MSRSDVVWYGGYVHGVYQYTKRENYIANLE